MTATTSVYPSAAADVSHIKVQMLRVYTRVRVTTLTYITCVLLQMKIIFEYIVLGAVWVLVRLSHTAVQ